MVYIDYFGNISLEGDFVTDAFNCYTIWNFVCSQLQDMFSKLEGWLVYSDFHF